MSETPGRFDLLGERLRENIFQKAKFLLKVDRRIKWLGAGMFCFALFSVMSFYPELVEKYYSQGLFPIIRTAYDYTIGILPFSATIWLNLVFFIWFSFKLFKYINFNVSNRNVSIINRVKYSALAAGSFLGKISVVFFVGWGFNYYRTPIEDYTQIEMRSLTTQDMVVEANIARKQIIEKRKQIPNLAPNQPFDASFLPDDIENVMRDNLNKAMYMMGYPTPGNVRCRIINNDYWLRTVGYTGMYVSFYGEALVSDKIAPVFRPFFIAHEMAHGYGFFDEADANFFAYMACLQSDDPAINYSGMIAHLIYIQHELEGLTFVYPDAIRTDLRSNGMFGSQEEYNRMILLVHAWRQKYPMKMKTVIHPHKKDIERDYSY